jgi:hypothetical protein
VALVTILRWCVPFLTDHAVLQQELIGLVVLFTEHRDTKQVTSTGATCRRASLAVREENGPALYILFLLVAALDAHRRWTRDPDEGGYELLVGTARAMSQE